MKEKKKIPHFRKARAPPMKEEDSLFSRLGTLPAAVRHETPLLPLEPELGSVFWSFSLHPMPVSKFQTVRNGTLRQFDESLNSGLLLHSTR